MQKEMTSLHPMTDAFAEWGMSYGLGLEGEWSPNGQAVYHQEYSDLTPI